MLVRERMEKLRERGDKRTVWGLGPFGTNDGVNF